MKIVCFIVLFLLGIKIFCQRPKAIQLDIEPYTLPQWTSNKQQTANQFLDLVDKIVQLTPKSIPLRFAIPRWFDGEMILRNGTSRPLSQWVQDKASIMIMDYVNSATRAIQDAMNEIQYGNKVAPKSVVVGIETMPLPGEEMATFFGQSNQVVESALTTIHNAFVGNISYEAVCIHYYTSWRQHINPGFTQPVTGPIRDLYVWDNSVVNNSTVFFNDVPKLKLRRIYLESASLVNQRQNWNKTKRFIDDLARLNVDIELMSGDNVWALTQNHHLPLHFVNNSIRFIQHYYPEQLPSPQKSFSLPNEANTKNITSMLLLMLLGVLFCFM